MMRCCKKNLGHQYRQKSCVDIRLEETILTPCLVKTSRKYEHATIVFYFNFLLPCFATDGSNSSFPASFTILTFKAIFWASHA